MRETGDVTNTHALDSSHVQRCGAAKEGQAARGRFRKATDLEPALMLLEEHGYLRRVDPEPSRDPHGRGRPASPRFVVNPLHPSSETTETTKTPAEPVSVVSEVSEKTNGSPQ